MLFGLINNKDDLMTVGAVLGSACSIAANLYDPCDSQSIVFNSFITGVTVAAPLAYFSFIKQVKITQNPACIGLLGNIATSMFIMQNPDLIGSCLLWQLSYISSMLAALIATAVCSDEQPVVVQLQPAVHVHNAVDQLRINSTVQRGGI